MKGIIMQAMKYQELKKSGKWVPKRGDIVSYHPIIGEPAESNGHTVTSVFPVASGNMVAFITGKQGFVSVEALSRDLEERGAM